MPRGPAKSAADAAGRGAGGKPQSADAGWADLRRDLPQLREHGRGGDRSAQVAVVGSRCQGSGDDRRGRRGSVGIGGLRACGSASGGSMRFGVVPRAALRSFIGPARDSATWCRVWRGSKRRAWVQADAAVGSSTAHGEAVQEEVLRWRIRVRAARGSAFARAHTRHLPQAAALFRQTVRGNGAARARPDT